MDETDIRQLLHAGLLTEAFEKIVSRYQDKVFHLALSFTREEAAARDLAQDAFLRLWKALPRYDGRAAISTWLYTITRNVCLTELRRPERNRTLSLDALEAHEPMDLTSPAGQNQLGAGDDVEAALAQLPPKYQQVLRLFYLEQRSYEETSTLLALPLGTVKTLLFRARKEAARLLAQNDQFCPSP